MQPVPHQPKLEQEMNNTYSNPQMAMKVHYTCFPVHASQMQIVNMDISNIFTFMHQVKYKSLVVLWIFNALAHVVSSNSFNFVFGSLQHVPLMLFSQIKYVPFTQVVIKLPCLKNIGTCLIVLGSWAVCSWNLLVFYILQFARHSFNVIDLCDWIILSSHMLNRVKAENNEKAGRRLKNAINVCNKCSRCVTYIKDIELTIPMNVFFIFFNMPCSVSTLWMLIWIEFKPVAPSVSANWHWCAPLHISEYWFCLTVNRRIIKVSPIKLAQYGFELFLVCVLLKPVEFLGVGLHIIHVFHIISLKSLLGQQWKSGLLFVHQGFMRTFVCCLSKYCSSLKLCVRNRSTEQLPFKVITY